MACTDLCYPSSDIVCPTPIANSYNDLCVRQCPDSRAVIQPPPVVVTFPGPILSSFPQESIVGSSGAPGVGGYGSSFGTRFGYSGLGGSLSYGSSGGYGGDGYEGLGGGYVGGSLGYRGGSLGYSGGLCGSGSLYNYGRLSGSGFGYGYCSPFSYRRYNRYRRGSCGPC
ncbi:PREDICTED: scale keratin-like [Gavialis gangeticus]|uniref:scale keratin-like n=1 Tax=Gavialis gangeticus TaxID=94835 RepID=UPI00092F0578|nr:PREDICTED: scale keratin-like [Gavialis gangeticus]